MGKRSNYIKKITGKEINLFKQLARTGLTDKSQSKQFFKINPNRLNQLENSKYIKRYNSCVAGKNTQLIQLDEKGIIFCRNKLGIDKLAHSQSNHLEHDLKVTYAYNQLPEEVQETWEHEREIIADIYDKNKDIESKYLNEKQGLKTCIDARVTINGVSVAIEIVGSSYSQADIELKEDIAVNLAECNSIEFLY
jgi:hypothetical protein